MIENHPLEPFIVEDAVVLMLGSFPPKREKWSMEFYYPNFINDMWRIFGLVFFEDKGYFLKDTRHFDKEKIQQFLCEKKIAVADAAQGVFRKKIMHPIAICKSNTFWISIKFWGNYLSVDI